MSNHQPLYTTANYGRMAVRIDIWLRKRGFVLTESKGDFFIHQKYIGKERVEVFVRVQRGGCYRSDSRISEGGHWAMDVQRFNDKPVDIHKNLPKTEAVYQRKKESVGAWLKRCDEVIKRMSC